MSTPSSKPAAWEATLPSINEVVARASDAVFGKPLVVNVWRALIVESLIDLVLPAEWTWCATDYAGWDFQHVDGTRLEVKQSAARQSWKASVGGPSSPRFDIAIRLRAWNGVEWVPGSERRRYADLYVLAFHPVADDTADHRDPQQWLFHVVTTASLPATKSISLAAVRQLAAPVDCAELACTVETMRVELQHGRT